MSLLKSLARSLTQQVSGRRTWTPAEVRELVDRRAFDDALLALNQLPAALENREAVRLCLLGEVLFQQRDDDGALAAFREALKLKPGLATAHYGLSLLMTESGDLDGSLRHAFFADSVEPGNARFVAQVGYCQLRLGNHPLAEAPLRRAAVLAPNNGHVWNNLALVLLARGQVAEAHDCFRLAVEKAPTLASAQANLIQLDKDINDRAVELGAAELCSHSGQPVGHAEDAALRDVHRLEREGALLAAIDACEAVLLTLPESTRVVLELNRLYRRAGDATSGTDALTAFLVRVPDDASVTGTLALALLDLHKYAKAGRLLLAAVETEPARMDFVLGLANALIAQEKFDEAAPWIDKALELEPERADILGLQAGNLASQCLYEESLAAYEALEAKGFKVEAKGLALAYLGRFNEAEQMFDAALQRQPNHPGLRFQRANVRLLNHNFEGGWEDYAYRAYTEASSFRVLPFPLWRGEDLEGKRLLVLAEQGLGDQVMFASCLPDVLELKPEELLVESHLRIAPTLARSFPTCRVLPTGQGRGLAWLAEVGEIDYYVPLGDLPRHFRRSRDQFPRHIGFLHAEPTRVAHWRSVLAEAGPPPYVGFSWKGGTPGTRSKLRTMKAGDFAAISSEGSSTWVCLQYGDVAAQLEDAARHGLACCYWPDAVADLDEFAALVSALDLVITVCNTTVHYAGACGRPVWVLAPKVPEWRYGARGDKMPWYPSASVYRQQQAGAWSELVARVRRDWSQRVAAHPTRRDE
jgi:tetratricopeptide (TPR) repeat protein